MNFFQNKEKRKQEKLLLTYNNNVLTMQTKGYEYIPMYAIQFINDSYSDFYIDKEEYLNLKTSINDKKLTHITKYYRLRWFDINYKFKGDEFDFVYEKYSSKLLFINSFKAISYKGKVWAKK